MTTQRAIQLLLSFTKNRTLVWTRLNNARYRAYFQRVFIYFDFSQEDQFYIIFLNEDAEILGEYEKDQEALLDLFNAISKIEVQNAAILTSFVGN